VEEQEECWDLIQVIAPPQDRGRIDCRTEGCQGNAVAVWQSSLDPRGHDRWPLCEQCQENNFGGDFLPAVLRTTDNNNEGPHPAAADESIPAAGVADAAAMPNCSDNKNSTSKQEACCIICCQAPRTHA